MSCFDGKLSKCVPPRELGSTTRLSRAMPGTLTPMQSYDQFAIFAANPSPAPESLTHERMNVNVIPAFLDRAQRSTVV